MKRALLTNNTGRFLGILSVSVGFELYFRDMFKLKYTLITFAIVLIMWYTLQKTRLKLPEMLYNLVVLFTFMAMYLGKIWGFYSIVFRWDKILHIISGIILGVIGYFIYYSFIPEGQRENRNPILGVLFSIFFSIAMAGVWEIIEYSGDHLLGMMSQNNSLDDTIQDIIAGTAGGLIISFKIYLFEKGRSFEFLHNLLKETDSGIM